MTITETDVLAIMKTSLTEAEITPFLTTAQAIVTATLSTSTLTTSILDEITKYLAAHFACIKSPFSVKKKLGDAEETYGYQGGKGLDATPYGETVKMMDSTGILVSKMSTQQVTFGIVDFYTDDTESTI